MVQSKSKAKATASKPTAKTEHTTPTSQNNLDVMNQSEATLRKLSRTELQKLAMAHKVRANMKSELIIRQLLALGKSSKTRPSENDFEDGTPRKRLKNGATSEGHEIPLASGNQLESVDTQPTKAPPQPSVRDPRQLDAELSSPRSTSLEHKVPAKVPYDRNFFSGTESEMTEEEQLDFATPVSSRLGTPPAANVIDLERCVKIMQEISAQDVNLLKEVADVHENAVKLRKRASDVRNLVRAERGRRERMEAYFRYWQETGPRWDRTWLYGETEQPVKPPTVPARHCSEETENATDGERTTSRELKRRREIIVSNQEAEQRQLEVAQSSFEESTKN